MVNHKGAAGHSNGRITTALKAAPRMGRDTVAIASPAEKTVAIPNAIKFGRLVSNWETARQGAVMAAVAACFWMVAMMSRQSVRFL